VDAMRKGEPIPFAGWIDDQEDTETMLREQIHAQQHEINRLKQELMGKPKEDDFDMDGRC
jgi:hypothetical protein